MCESTRLLETSSIASSKTLVLIALDSYPCLIVLQDSVHTPQYTSQNSSGLILGVPRYHLSESQKLSADDVLQEVDSHTPKIILVTSLDLFRNIGANQLASYV